MLTHEQINVLGSTMYVYIFILDFFFFGL